MTARAQVLVLGASGRLGRLLQRAWAQDPGFDVLWHSRSGPGGFEPLTDPDALVHAFSRARVVLNLAGPARGDAAAHAAHPALARALLKAGQATGLSDILWLSTAAVYGDHAGPLSETTAPAPLSPYGEAKLEMERIARAAPGGTVLRLGNVVGADALLGAARPDAPVMLDQFPDGTTPRRSYIGPLSLAQVLARLCHRLLTGAPMPPLLNLATPRPVAMAALLDAAGQPWQPRPAPPTAIPEVWLDTTALQKLAPLPEAVGTAPAMVAEWKGLRP